MQTPAPLKPATSPLVWNLTGRLGEDSPVRRLAINGALFQVGRRTDVDLTLEYRGVSKLHAQIYVEQGVCRVVDMGSTNGTYVNGQRINRQTALSPGDVVQFANAPFQVSCESAGDTARTQAELVTDQALALMQFDRLMNDRAVTPHFQPIIDMQSNGCVGYEVLARSRVIGLQTAAELFDTAALVDQEAELSRLLRFEGIREGQRINGLPEIFLNTHPAEVHEEELMQSLRELRANCPALPITLEVHEAVVAKTEQMQRLRDQLIELQIKLAYDDFGAGQARLIELIEVPPEYLKFDRHLIVGIDNAPPQRQQMLGTLVSMVKDLDIIPLAEGIETEGESQWCRDLGFVLAQGYLFGKPNSATRWISPE